MSKFSKYVIIALKGFGMGAGSVTPCVSAGTIALLTGIYSQFIDSLNALSDAKTWKALFHGRFKEFWELIGGNFLLALAIGFTISMLALAKLAVWGLSYWPVQTWSFFFGLIVASTVLLLSKVKNLRWTDTFFVLIGIAIGIGIFYLTPAKAPDSLLYIFICGAVSVCTMVLPGIAGSFVLQIMGKYETVMRALDFQNPNWPILIAFALGCVIGILAFSKFLKWLMSKWEKQTLLILTGFIIGSLVRIWPYHDMQALADAQLLRTKIEAPLDLQIPGAVIWCIIGVVFVTAIHFIGKRNSSRTDQ